MTFKVAYTHTTNSFVYWFGCSWQQGANHKNNQSIVDLIWIRSDLLDQLFGDLDLISDHCSNKRSWSDLRSLFWMIWSEMIWNFSDHEFFHNSAFFSIYVEFLCSKMYILDEVPIVFKKSSLFFPLRSFEF